MDTNNFQGEGEAPQNPDLLTRRIIFDKLTSDLSPTATTFVGEVMNLVCELKDVTQGMVNKASWLLLKKEAQDFTSYIRSKYKQSKISGAADFRRHYGESYLDKEFKWVPDIDPSEELIPTNSVLDPPVDVEPKPKKKNFPSVKTKLVATLKARLAFDQLKKRGRNARIAKAVQYAKKPVVMAAARQELVKKSGEGSGKVYDEMLKDPRLHKKLNKVIRAEPERIIRNPIESLSYYLDKDMSRKDWNDFRAFTGNGDFISYDDLKKQMDDILPSGDEISDFEAKVPMKNLLEKSVSRYFKDEMNLEMLRTKKKEKEDKEDGTGSDLNLKVSFKWGLDGTNPGGQYHQEGDEDRNNIVATQMVILQLEDEDTGEVYWRNPLANSCSACR